MKKLFFVLCVAMISLPAVGQEIDVPLFDDDLPNLGRDAKPQDEIIITPSQLPDVRIHLEDKEGKKVQKTPTRPLIKKSESEKKETTAKSASARPIALGNQISQQQSDAMEQQLNDEIQRYQEAKERAELEQAIKEAEQKKAAAQKEAQKAAAKDAKSTKSLQMPESMAALFGKTHDVYAFDIAGFELGMTPDDAVDVAQERGYAILRVEHGIPLHRTSYYEHNCRQNHVYRPDALQTCIIEQAQDDDVYHISSMTLEKPSTAEKIQLLFSTMATDNVIYKIYYENEGDNSLNFTQRNLAKKLNRRDAFWKMVYDAYGAPDDRDNMVWGDPQTAYLRAAMQGSNYNAYLILEDRTISDNDYIDATEQKDDMHYKHSFAFAEVDED